MSGTVSALSIVCMSISGLVGFAIPVVLCLYFKLKKRADLVPFFIGCAVFFLFALVLESIVHQLVLVVSPVGKTIQGNIWLYALYGGAMAGLFEETGRFIAFKTVLRRWSGKDVNALMYGAGHGGFEALMTLGSSMISDIVMAVMINTGTTSLLLASLSGDALAQGEAVLYSLASTSPYLFLIGIAERIFAVGLHISLSVFVWFAAKNAKRWYLFPLAIFLHFFVDASLVVLSGLGLPTLAIEGILCVLTAAVVLLAKKVWNDNTAESAVPEA